MGGKSGLTPESLETGEGRGMGQRRILIADDDEGIRQLVREALAPDDFEIVAARDGDDAIQAIAKVELDAAILDIMMPVKDGLEVLRELRKTSAIPVIMLSGKTDASDKVGALELGADDYLTKPFTGSELLARVRAVLRRGRASAVAGSLPDFDDGCLRIEFAGRRVVLQGAEVRLTRTEFDLLRELANNAGKAISYDRILEAVWGPEYKGDRARVRDYVNSLRQKIEPEAAKPRYIINLPGFGYRFSPQR